MQIPVQTLRTFFVPCRRARATMALGLLLILGLAQSALAQTGTNPLNIFKNYFVTGDYVVGGWVEGAPDGSGYAPGIITIPDTKQPQQTGVPQSVPKGAEIVAAYLYWATVESNQSTLAGKQAFFNNYAITGTTLGNLNAPVSWSSGGCSGSALGSKTMRTYRADVRPYMPVDTDKTSATFGALVANGSTGIPVRLADSGSNGNTTPFTLGATLVVIYRVLSPQAPLNAIVLYDGSYAPSNGAQSVSQNMVGFYQPAANPVAKLTQIVANGQMNKSQQVYLNNTLQPLLSIYGTATPPFPGIYGSWDNPTWAIGTPGHGYVNTTDTSETTSIVPNGSNSGCVSWGAMVLSTTVQDTDGDGLLDVWEDNQGYTDAVSSQTVALPGANKHVKDLFIEVDYLTDLDGSPTQHSHLPKQAALDAVGAAFANQGVSVHFDLGSNIYSGDPYVIAGGSGGNAILESAVVCTDGATLCAFPGQPAIAWKGGVAALQADTTLGNFQPGRSHSYHYALFGHSLGDARSFWSTVGAGLTGPTIPQLVSIANTGTSAVVTLQSPSPTFIKPGDCAGAMPPPACAIDSNTGRVTVSGALGQLALNGTYTFTNPVSTTNSDNTIKTTFTITTSGVATGTYTFTNEPQLGVAYMGPTSTSGHSDFGGGGDLAVTLGLWRADNAVGCQVDPSQPVTGTQVYCNDQVGTLAVQTGTLLHELGHTLTLTHGGTYYLDPVNNPSVPTYEVNCKPNFLSTMNYLFQVRGFVENGGFDYSGQTIVPLNEAYPSLSELAGIGVDEFTGLPAAHLTRWYSKPNALDNLVQSTAKSHCDGTPLATSEAAEVRVEGTASVLNPGALDWNNDLIVPDAVLSPGIDVNFNGITGDAPFSGFNDWQTINLQQMSGRASAFGFSDSGGIKTFGGGIKTFGGGVDDDGGGIKTFGGGIKTFGGGIKTFGGGIEQDEDTATSTFTPPTGLTAVMSNKKVLLNWTAPTFGQVREYDIWRATGSFPTLASVTANSSKFSNCSTCNVTGAPPLTTFTDSNIKNGTTYTYFVTDRNKQGAKSGASAPITITVKF